MPTPRPSACPGCGHGPADCPCFDRFYAVLQAIWDEHHAQQATA